MKTYGTYRIALASVVIEIIREESDSFVPSPGINELQIAVLRAQELPITELARTIAEMTGVIEVRITNWDKQGILIRK